MNENGYVDLGSGLFASDEWVRFCSEVWDLTPQILVLQEEGKPYPRLECILYRDRRGRIVQPPIHLYLGLRFFATSTADPIKRSRQWQQVLEQFASAMSSYEGVWLAFPPGVVDVRELRWKNFCTEVRYTYILNLPFDLKSCDRAVRKNVTKAERSGYHCSRLGVEHIPEMNRVLMATEERQHFSYQTDYSRALVKGFSIIGPDSFRCYGVWTQSNELVSVCIVLYRKGFTALGWVGGTIAQHLKYGVFQQLILNTLTDLAVSECKGFDLTGANIKSIGASKAEWGGQLVPFYTFRKKDISYIATEFKGIMRKRISSLIKKTETPSKQG